jgi:Transcription factor zinc-finger
MTDEKDRLGATLKKKERAEEERYFAEQDRERLEKLRAKRVAAEAAGHTASCPRCGQGLVERDRKGVMVDVCMWLDTGELEFLAGRDNDSWLSRLLDKAF